MPETPSPHTTPTTRSQLHTHKQEELTDLAAFLHTLEPAQWEHPSLCDGWAVRHVISHIAIGYTWPLWRIGAAMVSYRGNIDRASAEMSRRWGDEHSPAEILSCLERGIAHPRGISRLEPKHEALIDHLTHHQDIRRPLGMPREIPVSRLTAAFDHLSRTGGFVKTKTRVRGLRLVATDLDRSVGDGPEVRGAAEAIILAATGRPIVLGELSGAGVSELRARLGA